MMRLQTRRPVDGFCEDCDAFVGGSRQGSLFNTDFDKASQPFKDGRDGLEGADGKEVRGGVSEIGSGPHSVKDVDDREEPGHAKHDDEQYREDVEYVGGPEKLLRGLSVGPVEVSGRNTLSVAFGSLIHGEQVASAWRLIVNRDGSQRIEHVAKEQVPFDRQPQHAAHPEGDREDSRQGHKGRNPEENVPKQEFGNERVLNALCERRVQVEPDKNQDPQQRESCKKSSQLHSSAANHRQNPGREARILWWADRELVFFCVPCQPPLVPSLTPIGWGEAYGANEHEAGQPNGKKCQGHVARKEPTPDCGWPLTSEDGGQRRKHQRQVAHDPKHACGFLAHLICTGASLLRSLIRHSERQMGSRGFARSIPDAGLVIQGVGS